MIASSYHTLSVQSVVARYPEANIVGAPAAEAKLNHAHVLPRNEKHKIKKNLPNCKNFSFFRNKFDYDVTDETRVAAANSVLKNEGVELFYVAGDVGTNSVLAVAHGVALECDLVYGHHDGEGLMYIDGERWREMRQEDWGFRLFR